MPSDLSYVNKRGKRVPLTITNHARRRMLERWPRIYPTEPIAPQTVDAKIIELFTRAQRVTNLTYKELVRCKRHGKDTLLFRNNGFTFVVQDAAILTVEISVRDKRYLNKRPLIEPPALAPSPPTPEPSRRTKPKAESPPAPPRKLPAFKISATAEDVDGKLRSVSLGSYESATVGGQAALLHDDSAFRDAVRQRFLEKRPDWKLLGIFVRLGANGDFAKVFDGWELPDCGGRSTDQPR